MFRDQETGELVREDIETVLSSLHFINDFVRSILDVYRTNSNKMKVEMSPIDIRRDVFEHVGAILYKRVANFDVIIDCPANLMVMSDCVRLKQVVRIFGRGLVPAPSQPSSRYHSTNVFVALHIIRS